MEYPNKLYYLKIISWSIIAFTTSGIISYVWTRKIITSVGIAITELLVKFTMYSIFEYFWKNKCEDN
jgi:uncharacterized membrane protein